MAQMTLNFIFCSRCLKLVARSNFYMSIDENARNKKTASTVEAPAQTDFIKRKDYGRLLFKSFSLNKAGNQSLLKQKRMG